MITDTNMTNISLLNSPIVLVLFFLNCIGKNSDHRSLCTSLNENAKKMVFVFFFFCLAEVQVIFPNKENSNSLYLTLDQVKASNFLLLTI